MHEHFLHQVLLKIRIGGQFPCDPMQLTDNLIFSHSEHPNPCSHSGFDGRQQAKRLPVSNPQLNRTPLQVTSTIPYSSAAHAKKHKGLEVVTPWEM
jgi:hypothetical protein